MSDYELSRLSPADFEDLARDLVGEALNIRFEGFAPGPDGGIDGRHAAAGSATVLQAKHYAGSTFPALKAAMRRERPKIDQLAPDRYILATSRALSPANKTDLAGVIGERLRGQADLIGATDLHDLLRQFPDIAKAHIKLWLSSTAVLERMLHASTHSFTSFTKEEIEAKVRIYAQNPSFDQSRKILEDHHVLIVSGPPGVGKTTLAEMLAYAYVSEGWELVAMRSLEDGFSSIKDTKKQVYLFDDFLGQVALDPRGLAASDSALAKFIKRVRSSPNARFILTTRAYIFEEARRISEHLADKRLSISKYVLDVGIYTRRIKARILYNHLAASAVPSKHINALVKSGQLPTIVDHPNYNPRIVEWMTDLAHVRSIDPVSYGDAFLTTLAKPDQLWDTAFRTHIPARCHHLLIALFFCAESGASVDDLRAAYQALHPMLCAKFGEPHAPKDFEESLKVLEGGFIAIQGGRVSLVNPSLRDYLRGYLADPFMLADIASASMRANWAESVWSYATRLELPSESYAMLARSFLPAANQLSSWPVWRKASSSNTMIPCDVGPARRVSLLLDWWNASQDIRFINLAVLTAQMPERDLDAWRDADEIVETIGNLRWGIFEEAPRKEELVHVLEVALIAIINGNLTYEELERISDAVDRAGDDLDQSVHESVIDAIQHEFDNTLQHIEDVDSSATLDEYIVTLKKLASRGSIPDTMLKASIATVQSRIGALDEDTEVASAPQIPARRATRDDFDDSSLSHLFQLLLNKH